MPERLSGQNLGIPNDNNSELSSREGYVQSPRVIQEPDALMFIGSHAGENNEILFSSLEGIDRRNLQFLVQFLRHRTVELHVLHHKGPLSFVWGYDADGIRGDFGPEETSDYFLYVGGLSAVEIGSAG